MVSNVSNLLLCLASIMAFLYVIRVGTMMPFMAVLAKPELVESNRILALADSILRHSDKNKSMFIFGVAVFITLIPYIDLKAFRMDFILRFPRPLEYSIAKSFVDL